MRVRSFFKFHKIPLEVSEAALKPCVTYHNRDLSKEEIRRILEASKLRERTFFLVMAESGLRPDTLVKLKYKHIKDDFEAGRIPMKINLPAKILKDRVGERFTFIGEDGFKLLRTYLNTLGKLDDEDYIFQPEKGPKEKKPLPPTTFSNYFRKIALALGITERKERGKPSPVRLYCLRKYFRNHCMVESSLREFWMAHSLGTDEHYISRDVERHREAYKKNYENLRIYQSTRNEEIEALRRELEHYKKHYFETLAELEHLKKLIKQQKSELASQVLEILKDLNVISKERARLYKLALELSGEGTTNS